MKENESFGAFDRLAIILPEIKESKQYDEFSALSGWGAFFKSKKIANDETKSLMTEAYEGLVDLKKLFANAAIDVLERVDIEKGKRIYETVLNLSKITSYEVMNQNWPTIRNMITDADIYGLNIARDIMPPSKNEKTIKIEQINELIKKLMEIEKEIALADIDEETKSQFTYAIDLIIGAMNNYKLNGIDKIGDNLFVLYGKLSIYSNKKYNAKPWFDKIKPVINGIAQLIQTASAATALIDYFAK
jgi:hypothetical protein